MSQSELVLGIFIFVQNVKFEVFEDLIKIAQVNKKIYIMLIIALCYTTSRMIYYLKK